MRKNTHEIIAPSTSVTIRVGLNGELHLPEHLKLRWDLSPGSELVVEETPNGMYLAPSQSPLSKIYIEPTTICNLDCRTCVRNSWNEPLGSMPISTFRKLLYDLRDVHSLRTMAFWGFGEPLVHRDIIEMVSLAHERGLRTELITNGILLDKSMSQGLIMAGLDSLVVSVDGVSSESYAEIRCGGDLEQVQKNINGLHKMQEELSRNNPDIGLEFVLMRRNISQVPALRETAFNLGAKFIVLTNLLPYSEDMKDEILYQRTAPFKKPSQRSECFPEFLLPRLDMLPEYMEPILKLIYPFESIRIGKGYHSDTEEIQCPFIHEGSLSVTWAGDVCPCIALMHSYQCFILGREKSIKRYSLGNVANEKITDIWNKPEYREFRDRVREFEFSPCVGCVGCEFGESNEEDCLGNEHPVCGDCLWARRIVLCP